MQDPILFWNEVALEANRISHTNGRDEQTGPTRSSRALAIVHLAMYDAFARVTNTPDSLPPYLPGLPAPGAGAAAAAAVASAAHLTLSKLFPSQTAFFDLALAGAGDTGSAGHAYGLAVAEAMLADRAADPEATSPGYVASTGRGRHRPDPDNPGQGFHGAYYGARSKGFAITERFELAAPPFDDDEYRAALREVRGKGIAPELMGTLPDSLAKRTVDETLIGLFWAYDGVAQLGTPPRLYNHIIKALAMARRPGDDTQPNTTAENARLFAFVNAAMADAGILAWDQKYIHDLWRPVLGVREHDRSFGPGATNPDNNISDTGDPSWLPLGAPQTNRLAKNFTPPFPAYPSGHATFGAAAFHIARLFYNIPVGEWSSDTLFDGLSFVSEEMNGMSTDNKGAVRPRHLRNFPGGLWRMIEENGRSRVYLGVHWVFDAFAVKPNGRPDLTRKKDGKFIGGVPLGLQIAEDVFTAGGGLAPKKSLVGPRV
jgi:membrane-associated phospholipid phosphatase